MKQLKITLFVISLFYFCSSYGQESIAIHGETLKNIRLNNIDLDLFNNFNNGDELELKLKKIFGDSIQIIKNNNNRENYITGYRVYSDGLEMHYFTKDGFPELYRMYVDLDRNKLNLSNLNFIKKAPLQNVLKIIDKRHDLAYIRNAHEGYYVPYFKFNPYFIELVIAKDDKISKINLYKFID